MLKRCCCCITLLSLIFNCDGLSLGKGNKTLIFPDEVVPKCPNNQTFCEEVEMYPEGKFQTILQNSSYEDYFNSQSATKMESISNRFHPEKESFLCSSRTRILFPKVARNIKGDWKFVYNFDKYKQAIITEECISGATCTSLYKILKMVKTKCVEKTSEFLMLVADENASPVWDLFTFPSACMCSYEFAINFNSV